MYTILDPSKFENQYHHDLSALSPFDVGFPLVELSDKTVEQIYYYRWHMYCSHIQKTPAGYVVTEFSHDVPWAGSYNTISCPVGHHLYEGRWLHNKHYLQDYAKFWFTPEANLRQYSSWIADAIYTMCKTWGDFSVAKQLYDDLKANYHAWQAYSLSDRGLYYQYDCNDGMELSISGHGFRPTLNSYQYADAKALAKIAQMLGKAEDVLYFTAQADGIKKLIDTLMWDGEKQFYLSLSDTVRGNSWSTVTNKENLKKILNEDCYKRCDARELLGYIPWYFNLPDEDKSGAWKFLRDEHHFSAPYGFTTAERCHPRFMEEYSHECLWNGPVWPFATSQTLTALGNLLTNYNQSVMCKHDYFDLLHQYAASQFLEEDGARIPFVDEDLDPFTGVWLAREILKHRNDPHTARDRGEHYNHSTFCDLVLTGLAGLRARADDVLEIDPLFEADDLSYFCADGIPYHGRSITVVWDRDGSRYGFGKGLHVFCDGAKLGSSENIEKRTYII